MSCCIIAFLSTSLSFPVFLLPSYIFFAILFLLLPVLFFFPLIQMSFNLLSFPFLLSSPFYTLLLSVLILLTPPFSSLLFPLILSRHFLHFPSLLECRVVLFRPVHQCDGWKHIPQLSANSLSSPPLLSLYHSQSSSTKPLSGSHNEPRITSSLAGQI